MAALVALILLAGPVPGAQAGLVGLERVEATSATSSSNKGVTASCPAGKNVIGAGGDVTPGFGEVVIDDIVPSATSVAVNAKEDGTRTPQDWYVQAFAICAYAPPGLQRVIADTVSDSSASKVVTASCPTGKKLLGTGALINPGNGEAWVHRIVPDSTLTSVTVRAAEDENGTAADWSLRAYAVCSTPVTGLRRVAKASTSDSNSPKIVEAPCPAGTSLIGLGGNTTATNGQLVIDAMYPTANLAGAGFAVWEDETGYANAWTATAYGICAATTVRVGGYRGRSSPSEVGHGVRCPGRTRVSGGGFDIDGGAGEVFPSSAAPFVLGSGENVFTAVAAEDATGTDRPWDLGAFAICHSLLPGHVITSARTAYDDSDLGRLITATCPTGTRTVGGGGTAERSDGSVETGASLHWMGPLEDTGSNYTASAGEAVPNTNSWRLTARAACATDPPGLEWVQRSSREDSEEYKSVTATCPSGKRVYGAGASGGRQTIHLDEMRPNESLSSVTVAAFESETGYASNWFVTAYARCANP